MPFKSAKQKRWMYANHPTMARRWSAEEKAVSKSYGYYQNTPTTKKEQRRERARNTASGALTTGGASAGLTAALNPRGGRLRPAVQMAAIGGGIGGALGASRKPRKYRTSYQPIAKSLPSGYGKKAQVFVGAGGTRMRTRRKPMNASTAKLIPPVKRASAQQMVSDPLTRPFQQRGAATRRSIALATSMRDGMKAQTPGLRQLSRRPGAYNPANSHEGGYLRIRKSLEMPNDTVGR